MKKLFFAFLVATLSVVSAFAESKNFQEEPVEWSHSLLATKEDSKTYEINEDGYKQGSILISYNNTTAVGSVTISIYNASGVRIGGVVVRPEQLKKNTFREFTFSSNTGEDIKKVVVHFVGSYKRTYKDLILTKSSITNKKYCLVKRIDEKKQYTAGWWSNKNVIYDFANIPTNYTKQLVFSARTSDYSALVDEGEFVIKVLRRGGDGYEVLQGWDAYTNGFCHISTIYVVEIPHNVVSVMFSNNGNSGASLDRIVEYVEIYKDNILKSDKNQLDFGSVLLGKSKTLEFTLDYVNIYELSKSLSAYSNCFSIDYTPAADCAEGTQTVKVTFTPSNCVENYDATLTFYNGKTVTINLTGARVRNSGTVKEITWTGAVDANWDNRDNWIKEDGSQLLCTDRLSKNLTVILPAPNSTKYKVPEGGITQYPIIPDVSTQEKFFTERNKKWNGNQVNAGDNATATMIADKIYMESCAALVGVETLKTGDVSRYREVQMDFIPERFNSTTGFYEWSLVGPVVKPWDEEGNTRDVVSGDYYKNDLPHVKMHEAVMIKDGEDYIQTWENSFASLTVKIPHNKAFAIRMPNQYGRNSSGNGVPASIYNTRNGTEYDAKKNVTFTFTGRFYNEAGLPEYTGLTPEVPVLLNNTYPANIDADMLQSKGYGTIQCYEGHSFVDVKDRTDAVISSGYGFIFTPNVAEFTIPSDCFQTTKVINNRNAEAEVPSLKLQLKNENVDGVYSAISISHDELKDDAADYAVDAPKLFNDMESNLADLYVMRYDSKWAGLTVPTVEESIPLGIKVRTANQKYKFNLLNSNLDCDIILEDRQEAKEYNLSAGEVCEVSNLAVGDCRYRFYLKTSESAEEDEDVTTDVFESEVSTSIDIYANGNSVTVSSNDNIRSIIVSDLSGRQMNYNVNGQYIVLDLPVASGIYTINVIGDNTSRIAKLKLN